MPEQITSHNPKPKGRPVVCSCGGTFWGISVDYTIKVEDVLVELKDIRLWQCKACKTEVLDEESCAQFFNCIDDAMPGTFKYTRLNSIKPLMTIRLRTQHGTHPVGSVHLVRAIIPHGGHSNSAKQYVLDDDTYVLSDNADVVQS